VKSEGEGKEMTQKQETKISMNGIQPVTLPKRQRQSDATSQLNINDGY